MVFDHLVLGHLLPQCPLQVGYSHFDGLLAETVCLGILVVFEALDVQVHAVLGLDVFDVAPVQVHAGLLVDYFCLLKRYLALALLDINVG